MSQGPTWLPATLLVAGAVFIVGLSLTVRGHAGWDAIWEPEVLFVAIALLIVLADFLFFGHLPFWREKMNQEQTHQQRKSVATQTPRTR